MKIVIDRDIPYIKGVLEPYAEVIYKAGSLISAADVRDADALVVRTRTRCDRALLGGSSVKLIATATIGFDHIDTDYCRKAGIEIATAAGSNARGVLQWMAAALVYASETQGWSPRGKRIGVVGVGNVGSLVAAYARLWGFDVLCCDPPRQRLAALGKPSTNGDCGESSGGGLYTPGEFVPFDRIVSDCDIITFHTPLILDGEDATHHLAGEDFFGRIRPGALVINCARGGVTDTAAMLGAAASGKCACCIDTWEGEPDIDRGLLAASLVSTPHIAGYSAQGKANATSMSINAVARKFGLPLAGWYPADEIPRVTPQPIDWDGMRRTITGYCDLAAESRALKGNPGGFEEMRNNYRYRTEYF